jgi:hypothetical protein
MYTAPPELMALTPEQLETLCDIIGQLPTDLQEFSDDT